MPPHEMRASSNRLRVLAVDDNKDGADSLAFLLRAWGYDVRVAYDGLDALEIVKSYQPDVGLIDLGLPVLDGYQLAFHLRQQPGLRDMILIAITGNAWREDIDRSQEYGFDEHLVKPVEPDALHAILESLRIRQPS